MLMGEHAVVHGRRALACAIDRFITVTLMPRTDTIFTITAQGFQTYQGSIKTRQIEAPYPFVLTAIFNEQYLLKYGFDLTITSTMSHRQGLGSSAAVTVATVKVLATWLQQPLTAQELLIKARSVVREVQGSGSGTDVAASVYGGVVSYRAEPCEVVAWPIELPISLVYVGYKTSTAVVVEKVRQQLCKHPRLINSIFDAMDQCVQEAQFFLLQSDWSKLGEVMNIHQGLQDSLGVNNALLAELIEILRQHPKIYGAKISGSGLGDCILGLGCIEADYFPTNPKQHELGICTVPVTISTQGVL